MQRIKKLIGESVWQGGVPLLKTTSYINPFAKALSSSASTSASAFKPMNPHHLDSDSSDFEESSSGGSLFSKHAAKHVKAKC